MDTRIEAVIEALDKLREVIDVLEDLKLDVCDSDETSEGDCEDLNGGLVRLGQAGVDLYALLDLWTHRRDYEEGI